MKIELCFPLPGCELQPNWRYVSKLGGKYLGNIIPMIVPLKREGEKEGKLLIKLKDKQIRERKNAFTKIM